MSKHLIPSSATYISGDYNVLPTTAIPGMMMFDTSHQKIMVYANGHWQELNIAGSMTMTFEAEEAIDEIIKHLQGQQTITSLAAKYEIVAEALGQLEVAMKLCENLDDINS